MRRALLTACAISLLIVSAFASAGAGALTIEPQEIKVGLFYSGHRIRVTADAPAAADVVMRLSGAEEALTLKKKGRKFGFLWMNVGELHYDAVPTVYLVHSSRGLSQISSQETLDRLLLGFDSLRERIPADAPADERKLFDELVKLKSRDRLFSCQSGVVERSPERGGGRASTEFLLPAKAPVGEYNVDVFSFENGKGTLLASAQVPLERAAVVSFFNALVAEHGLLYGCFAVALALVAGLLTGFVFGRGRGGAH